MTGRSRPRAHFRRCPLFPLRTTCLIVVWLFRSSSSQPWMDLALDPDQRASSLLAVMSLADKVSLLHGPKTGVCCECPNQSSCAYTGNVAPLFVAPFIPPLHIADGPEGFRDANHPGTSTAFPSSLTIAATWNVEAAELWGSSMGTEFLNKGR